MRNWEVESIRGRAESMGRCVKLKTVTDIRGSIAVWAGSVSAVCNCHLVIISVKYS